MSDTLIDSYSESNVNTNIVLDSDYSDGPPAGQSFTNLSTTMLITSAKFYMRYGSGSPTGNIFAKLYAHSGTYGTSSVPTGSALATSDAIAANTIGVGNALYEFQFTGANQAAMTASAKYCIVLDGSAVGDASNYVSYGIDSTSPTATGNYFFATSPGVWSAFPSDDMAFYVYGIAPTTTSTSSSTSISTSSTSSSTSVSTSSTSLSTSTSISTSTSLSTSSTSSSTSHSTSTSFSTSSTSSSTSSTSTSISSSTSSTSSSTSLIEKIYAWDPVYHFKFNRGRFR